MITVVLAAVSGFSTHEFDEVREEKAISNIQQREADNMEANGGIIVAKGYHAASCTIVKDDGSETVIIKHTKR